MPVIDHTHVDWPGNLWMCNRWCGNPWQYCVRPEVQTREQAALPVNVTEEALAWYRTNVFGTVDAPVTAVMLDNATMRVTVGPNGDGVVLTEDVGLSEPGRDGAAFMLGEGSRFRQGLDLLQGSFVFLTLAQRFTWASRHGASALGGDFAVGAVVLNAMKDALHARFASITVSVYGCSRGGKVAGWAVSIQEVYGLSASSRPFDAAYIDSGGTLGPASVHLVGQCGESWDALVSRWPQWLAPGAPQLPRLASSWPYDVPDYLRAGCFATKFTFSVARNDLWNNYQGTIRSIEKMRAAGCSVHLVEGDNYHCGYFNSLVR